MIFSLQIFDLLLQLFTFSFQEICSQSNLIFFHSSSVSWTFGGQVVLSSSSPIFFVFHFVGNKLLKVKQVIYQQSTEKSRRINLGRIRRWTGVWSMNQTRLSRLLHLLAVAAFVQAFVLRILSRRAWRLSTCLTKMKDKKAIDISISSLKRRRSKTNSLNRRAVIWPVLLALVNEEEGHRDQNCLANSIAFAQHDRMDSKTCRFHLNSNYFHRETRRFQCFQLWNYFHCSGFLWTMILLRHCLLLTYLSLLDQLTMSTLLLSTNSSRCVIQVHCKVDLCPTDSGLGKLTNSKRLSNRDRWTVIVCLIWLKRDKKKTRSSVRSTRKHKSVVNGDCLEQKPTRVIVVRQRKILEQKIGQFSVFQETFQCGCGKVWCRFKHCFTNKMTDDAKEETTCCFSLDDETRSKSTNVGERTRKKILMLAYLYSFSFFSSFSSRKKHVFDPFPWMIGTNHRDC